MKRFLRAVALLLGLGLGLLPAGFATRTPVATVLEEEESAQLFALAFVQDDSLSAVHLLRLSGGEALMTAIPPNTRCRVESAEGTMSYAPLRMAFDGSEASCRRLEEALTGFLPTGALTGFAVIEQDGLALTVDEAGGLAVSVTDIPPLALLAQYAGTSYPAATDNTAFGFALKREIERQGLTPGYDLDAGHAAHSVRPSDMVVLSGQQMAQAFYFTVFADPGVGTDISTLRRQGDFLLALLEKLPAGIELHPLYQSGEGLRASLAALSPTLPAGAKIPPGYDRTISGTTYWIYNMAALRDWCIGKE